MRKPVKVAEWQPVELPARLDNARVHGHLLRAGRSQRGPAFQLSMGVLKARGLVGLVCTSQLDVQILPKVYVGKLDNDAGAQLLRAMLAAELSFPSSIQVGRTASRDGVITELLIGHIARVLATQLEAGTPRRYYERVAELSVVRGRVDFDKLSRKLPIYSHIVPVRYAPLQSNNHLSQLIKATVLHLRDFSVVGSHRKALEDCLDILADVEEVALTTDLAGAVELNAFEEDWGWFIGVARSLAEARSPDLIAPGGRGGLAILFPLDGLFESLIRRSVKRGLVGTGYRMADSKSIGRLFHNTKNHRNFMSLEPDLVVVDHEDRIIAIGDAKWKRQLNPEMLVPDRADAFQMISYLYHAGIHYGVMYYPSAQPLDNFYREQTVCTSNGAGILKIIEVDVKKLASSDKAEVSRAEEALASAFVASSVNLVSD